LNISNTTILEAFVKSMFFADLRFRQANINFY